MVNFTGFDYLVYFKFENQFLLKYLESGDSLPLSKKFDEAKVQIKMLDEEAVPKKDAEGNRVPFEEEIACRKKLIADMRSEQNSKYKNWSALVPIKVLKVKLGIDESSYLSNGKSKYTFIRKTKSDIVVKPEDIIDINLMPGVILKNCLPFQLKLVGKDSSDVLQTITLQKQEERNLFCFNMAKSVTVDVHLPEFEVVKDFKLFNLEKFKQTDFKIKVEDRYGRISMIYVQIQRRNAGQRILFYCKQLLVDSIESDLRYFYKKPTIMGNKQRELIENMIPFVNNGILRQRFYIIPDELGWDQIFVALHGEYTRKECVKIDASTVSTLIEFSLRNQMHVLNFCYETNIYLASIEEYLYTKITTVNPQYVILNKSSKTILLEQSENPRAKAAAEPGDQLLPLVLEPGQRSAFYFYNIRAPQQGQEEFLRLRIHDELLPAQSIDKAQPPAAGAERLPSAFTCAKSYHWSNAFVISAVSKFTLKLNAAPSDAATASIAKLKAKDQRQRVSRLVNSAEYLRINCVTDAGQNMGSMFVLITEEEEEHCEYKIINESENFDMVYRQHFNMASMQPRLVTMGLKGYVEEKTRLRSEH